MSFLSKIFGGPQKTPILMAFYDGYVQAAQGIVREGQFELTGFNEMSFSEEVFKNGDIMSIPLFQDFLRKLFSSAQPDPFSGKKVWINIPFSILYSFVRDFCPRIPESDLKKEVMGYVANHAPLPVKESVFSFARYVDHSLSSYGVISLSARWLDRFKKGFQRSGLKLRFIPEPYVTEALIPEKPSEDCFVIAAHEDSIVVSIFHNGLLYDTFLLNDHVDFEHPNCKECFNRLEVIRGNFFTEFKKEIQLFYFLNFSPFFIDHVSVLFSKTPCKTFFLMKKDYGFSDIFKTTSDVTLLTGLLKKSLEKEHSGGYSEFK